MSAGLAVIPEMPPLSPQHPHLFEENSRFKKKENLVNYKSALPFLRNLS